MQQIDALLSTYHSIVRLHTLHIAIHSLAAKYKRGFLDVCKLRNHATNELWRQYAVTVGVIFFIRYCLQISDYVKLTKTENGVASKTDYWVRFFQIFSAKLVLEVFGGAGAVWYVTSYHCNTVRFKIFFWLFRIYLCNNQFFCPYKGDSRKF